MTSFSNIKPDSWLCKAYNARLAPANYEAPPTSYWRASCPQRWERCGTWCMYIDNIPNREVGPLIVSMGIDLNMARVYWTAECAPYEHPPEDEKIILCHPTLDSKRTDTSSFRIVFKEAELNLSPWLTVAQLCICKQYSRTNYTPETQWVTPTNIFLADLIHNNPCKHRHSLPISAHLSRKYKKMTAQFNVLLDITDRTPCWDYGPIYKKLYCSPGAKLYRPHMTEFRKVILTYNAL